MHVKGSAQDLIIHQYTILAKFGERIERGMENRAYSQGAQRIIVQLDIFTKIIYLVDYKYYTEKKTQMNQIPLVLITF